MAMFLSDQSTPPDPEALLEVLQDDRSRDILRTVRDSPRTASEISTACDLPLSTAYRKLDQLTDVGLVEEFVRVSPHGKNPKQYRARPYHIAFSIETGGEVEFAFTDPVPE